MKDFVLYIVKNLVDAPDDVTINVAESTENTVVEIRVAKEDIGKVVGIKGRNINALRRIVSLIGIKQDRHIQLELIQ